MLHEVATFHTIISYFRMVYTFEIKVVNNRYNVSILFEGGLFVSKL